MRLSFDTNAALDRKSASYLQIILTAIIVLLSLMILSAPAQAKNSSQYPNRSEAANPDNFKRILINGRAVSMASVPCPISDGIINCALKKLEVINEPAASIDGDYDLVQVFYYPNTEQAKTAVVIAQQSGLMDDSVRAIRYRVSFQLEDGGTSAATWNWVQYGEQVQCARGKMAGKWIKGRCL